MRTTFALLLAVTLGACGSDSSGDGGDDGVGSDGGPTADPPDLMLVSPDINIDPGQEVTYCWYFRTSNTKPLAIKQWQSTMTPGSHHLILYTTTTDVLPVNTVSTNCDSVALGGGTWTYAAQTPLEDLKLPADDGAGKPVAMEIGANQSGFLQMHYNNRTDVAIKAHVEVGGYALPEGTAYTRTAAYVTYNADIDIMVGETGHIESKSCAVPTTSKFWLMSTHAHKSAVHTAVKDGTTVVFESDSWEHPGSRQWDAPFYSFASGRLTYECTYNNTTGLRLRSGPSAQYNEMCMASGYFFPATRPVFCINSLPLPQ